MVHDPSQCPKFHVDCINRKILDQISGKWSIMVLTMLGYGPHRFNAIRKQLEGVSQKALTDTLRKLERNGVVDRNVLPTSPVGVEYELTSLGLSLRAHVLALYNWTEENGDEISRARAAFDKRAA
ncbi:winged helix-turn-helix transcriptional regulator [Martelella soudanensis]|uniref:winged helix-turn-helix transcriptional regulator n=1 Tax=unclassified Martelella TaxID=2629616 RepID=UPI0015DEE785|nr:MULTISPECIES: helix-turn-helix domain-containing protein [unclassified Martelella]